MATHTINEHRARPPRGGRCSAARGSYVPCREAERPRIATLAVPIAVNLSMPAVYRQLARALGPQRGYIGGFGV